VQTVTQVPRRWLTAPATRRWALLAAVVGVALTAPSAHSVVSGSPSFSKPQRYPTGMFRGQRLHADAVAVGDVNGDRRQDLVAVGSDTRLRVQEGAVSVSLNRGRGKFGAARTYRIGYDSGAVAIRDLSGDGKPDLATANGEDVSVLINRGGGRFANSVEYAARQSWDLAIGDVNGDGNADLVTANGMASVNSISVFMNRGAGSFSARVDYRTGRRPVSVAIADLNGDGTQDVATASLTNTVSVLLNSGKGSFAKRIEYPAPQHPRSIAIGDMNGDRNPDLVTANAAELDTLRSDSVSVFLNRGDGSFRPRRDYRAKSKSGFGPVAIGDLNGDGRQDVAVGQDLGEGISKPKRIAVLVGRGDGSFTRRIDFPTGRTAVDAWAPRGIALGQLNGDGKLDMAEAKFIDVAVLVNTTPR
jgi:FG-GAP-like repeat